MLCFPPFLEYPSWIIWVGSDCDLRIVTGRAARPDLLSPPLFPLFRAFVRPSLFSVRAMQGGATRARERSADCAAEIMRTAMSLPPVALHLRGRIWPTRSTHAHCVKFHFPISRGAAPSERGTAQSRERLPHRPCPCLPSAFPAELIFQCQRNRRGEGLFPFISSEWSTHICSYPSSRLIAE